MAKYLFCRMQKPCRGISVVHVYDIKYSKKSSIWSHRTPERFALLKRESDVDRLLPSGITQEPIKNLPASMGSSLKRINVSSGVRHVDPYKIQYYPNIFIRSKLYSHACISLFVYPYCRNDMQQIFNIKNYIFW